MRLPNSDSTRHASEGAHIPGTQRVRISETTSVVAVEGDSGAGLSKSELGRRCEKGYRTVQAWIRGEQEPSAESLLALATALGVSADELLGTQVAAHASTGHKVMRATVGDRIREARLAAGFENASEFGRLVGVTPTTVYRWERGQVVPTIFALHDIARACGASMEWLVSGAESDDFRRGVIAAAEAAARAADV